MSQSKKFWYANIYPSLVPKGLNADDQIIMQKIYFESKTMKGSKGFSFSSFSSFAERLKHKSPQSVAVRISELVEKSFLKKIEIDDVEISYKKIGYAPTQDFLEIYEPQKRDGSFIKYTSLHADAGITPAMAVFIQTVKNESLPTFTQLCGKFYEYCGQQTAKNRDAGKNDTRQGYRFLNSELEVSAPNETVKFKDFFDKSAPQEIGCGTVVSLSKKGYQFEAVVSQEMGRYFQTTEGRKFAELCGTAAQYKKVIDREVYSKFVDKEVSYLAQKVKEANNGNTFVVTNEFIARITGAEIGERVVFDAKAIKNSFFDYCFDMQKNYLMNGQSKFNESNASELVDKLKTNISKVQNLVEKQQPISDSLLKIKKGKDNKTQSYSAGLVKIAERMMYVMQEAINLL